MKIYLKLAEVPGIAREILMGKNRFLKIPNFKAEVPGDARGIKKNQIIKKEIQIFYYMLPLRYPWVSPTNFSLFGPAVLLAIANIYT